MMLTAAAMCLAMNVYHEARGEPVNGQVAVAAVTMNRVRQQNTDVCTEVYKHKQFSWTNGRFILKKKKVGKTCIIIKKPNPAWTKRYAVIPKNKAWQQAVYVAMYALKKKPTVVADATFYHADYVAPKWRLDYKEVRRIGQHIFYKKG